MAEYQMPLLSHTGGELSLPVNAKELADPRCLLPALDEGVTVIAAHAGSSSHYFDTNFMRETAALIRSHSNLYVDNSGMNTPIRSRHFRTLLSDEFAGRVIHGSDLPISISPLWVRLRGMITKEDYLKCRNERNIIQRDVEIKNALGFPPDALTLLSRLLKFA